MGQYDRQIASAKRLITKYGQSVTWRKMSNGTPPDASKPWLSGVASNSDTEVKIAFFPYSTENKQLLRHLLGTEIPVGSLTGYMPAVTFTPTLKDTVIRNGKSLSIKSIDPLAPNGDIIMYTLQFEESGI